MDEICAALSLKLAESGKGKYCVFYEDELLDALPENERSADKLEAAVAALAEKGFADVKYARGGAFCIAFLKPYLLPEKVPENMQNPPYMPAATETRVSGVSIFIIAASALLCALLGSFLGGLLGAAL